MAGSIPLVGSVFKQELQEFARDLKEEGPCVGVQHALLYLPEFDLKHFIKLRSVERMKHHHPVQAIHEFRRELPSRRLYGGTLHLLLQSRCRLGLWLD